MRNLPKTIGLLLSLCAAPALQASLVVNFDTDTNGTGTLAARISQQNIDIDGDSLNDDSRQLFGFNNIGGASWSTGASYAGPALYGGFIGESLNVANRTTGDYGLSPFNLRWQPTGTNESGRLHIAVLFDAGGSFLFDAGAAGTSFMQVSGNDGGAMPRFENLGQARWLVRDGSTLYVSQTLIANDAGGRVLDSAEMENQLWAVYSPADAYAFNLSLTFDTPTNAFSDLNAFGLITYKAENTAVRHWLSFTEFKVDAVAVPEPATIALLLGFCALGLAAARRRARR